MYQVGVTWYGAYPFRFPEHRRLHPRRRLLGLQDQADLQNSAYEDPVIAASRELEAG